MKTLYVVMSRPYAGDVMVPVAVYDEVDEATRECGRLITAWHEDQCVHSFHCPAYYVERVQMRADGTAADART